MPITKPEDLPPYGVMWWEFEEAARQNPKPADWVGGDWATWVDDVAAAIALRIWPEWDRGWKGAAEGRMVDLTRQELTLVEAFGQRYFSQPAWPSGPSTHAELYAMEDQGGWDQTLIRYCPELAPWAPRCDAAIRGGLQSKAADLDLALKRRLQRTRAYQVAVLEDRRTFRQAVSRTAFTPSAISGHCYQSMIGGFTAWLALEREDPAAAARNAAAIARWITDIGDRRVMAGVHYPADSIASWVVAHRLAPRVFREADVAAGMAEAIRGSLLYGFVRDNAAPGSALAAVRDFLDGELA